MPATVGLPRTHNAEPPNASRLVSIGIHRNRPWPLGRNASVVMPSARAAGVGLCPGGEADGLPSVAQFEFGGWLLVLAAVAI